MTKLKLALLIHTNELKGVLLMESENFTWTKFYSEFADKLLPFKNNRGELLSAYFGRIRTLIPETSGQRFGIIRTA
jgi:hypothetical protein